MFLISWNGKRFVSGWRPGLVIVLPNHRIAVVSVGRRVVIPMGKVQIHDYGLTVFGNRHRFVVAADARHGAFIAHPSHLLAWVIRRSQARPRA